MPFFRPSLKTGFARSPVESLYPNLWDRMTLALVPALGIGGDTLTNWALRKSFPGDLKAGSVPPVWALVKGPCIQTSGGVSGVETINAAIADKVIGTRNVTILIHQEKRDGTNRASAALSTGTIGNNASQCALHLPYSDGTVYWDFGGNSGAARISVGGLTVSGDNVWIVSHGGQGKNIWQNGILKATSDTTTSRSLFGNNALFRLFQGPNTGGGGSDSVNFYEILIWNRNLTSQERFLLNKNPLAPFILKRPTTVAIS